MFMQQFVMVMQMFLIQGNLYAYFCYKAFSCLGCSSMTRWLLHFNILQSSIAILWIEDLLNAFKVIIDIGYRRRLQTIFCRELGSL